MSTKITDAEFRATVDKIARGDNRDELMPAFLNERMEIDPTQVFRVLQLSNDMMNKPRK
jgi:hypothetical protein|tara:strand:- start:635 stop:811 length:177 start_codon:yes stop_codon:yes gene_type:complete